MAKRPHPVERWQPRTGTVMWKEIHFWTAMDETEARAHLLEFRGWILVWRPRLRSRFSTAFLRWLRAGH